MWHDHSGDDCGDDIPCWYVQGPHDEACWLFAQTTASVHCMYSALSHAAWTVSRHHQQFRYQVVLPCIEQMCIECVKYGMLVCTSCLAAIYLMVRSAPIPSCSTRCKQTEQAEAEQDMTLPGQAKLMPHGRQAEGCLYRRWYRLQHTAPLQTAAGIASLRLRL